MLRPMFRQRGNDLVATRGFTTPYRASNANAVIERYMGTLRRECLNHYAFLSERHLEEAAPEFT